MAATDHIKDRLKARLMGGKNPFQGTSSQESYFPDLIFAKRIYEFYWKIQLGNNPSLFLL